MSEFIERDVKQKCKFCSSPLVVWEERTSGVFFVCLVCKRDFPEERKDGKKIMTFHELSREFNS